MFRPGGDDTPRAGQLRLASTGHDGREMTPRRPLSSRDYGLPQGQPRRGLAGMLCNRGAYCGPRSEVKQETPNKVKFVGDGQGEFKLERTFNYIGVNGEWHEERKRECNC